MPRKPKLKTGDIVHLKNRKRTAIVLAVYPTHIRPDYTVSLGVFLDKPLGTFRYWNVDDLVKV